MRMVRHLGVVLAGLAAFIACGTDADTQNAEGEDGGADAPSIPPPTADPTPPPAPPAADSGSDAADASVDVFVPPLAVGDPCRGFALPVDQHYVAAGMCARLVERSIYPIRQITFAPNGDLFGVDVGGDVVLLRDDDGNGFFDANEHHLWGNTGGNGNDCHIDVAGGYLYAGSPDGVARFPWSLGALAAGGPAEPVVVNQPTGGHPFHTVHVYDGFLYVHSGSLSDMDDPAAPAYDTNRALLRRFDLSKFVPGTPFDWLSGEVVVLGLRNMVGFTKNAAGRMWGVVNGIDPATYQGVDVHTDNPGEQVLELVKGKQYGFPFCFTAQRVVVSGTLVAPGTQLWNEQQASHDDAWCLANASPPATFLQAHSAPLDILFFDHEPKGVLPEKWRGGAFITMHGSSQRPTKTGYKVVWMPFDASGSPPMPTSTTTTTTFPYETVFGGGTLAGGPVDGDWYWSDGLVVYDDHPRPVGVAISPIDGALYIASDTDRIYRVGLSGK